MFGPSGLLWSFTVQFSPFDLFRSLWSNLINLGHFQSNSVHFGLFDPFGPHLSNLTYLIHSVDFSPFGLIWSIFVHFSLFGPIRCTYLRMEKWQILVKSTINYLSNINCNYRISFSYHNNPFKKMRIWIIPLKLKNFSCTKKKKKGKYNA